MDQDSTCAEQDGGYELPPSFWQAVTALDATTGPVITEIIRLYREFPAWAVWLPRQGGPWTAARPASGRPPVPDLPMVWAHADTARALADRMRGVDWQLG